MSSVIERSVGAEAAPLALRKRLSVLLIAAPVVLYFSGVAIYAMIHREAYASDLPRIIRYVAGPLCISLMLSLAVLLLRRDRALAVAASAVSVLAALFVFEARLTLSTTSAALGLVGYTASGAEPSRALDALPPAYTLKALNNELGVARLADALLAGAPGGEVRLCSRDGAGVDYVADRYGFNNPDVVHDAPVQVALVGDSFVEGICLPPGEDLAGQLRKRMAGVVGLGTRGAGPLFELAMIGRYGPAMRPRHTVLVFFAGNDWENLQREKMVPWLREALNPDADFGAPLPDPVILDHAAEITRAWWRRSDEGLEETLRRRSMLRNFLALQQTALQLGLHYPRDTHEQPVFEETLRRAAQLVERWGGDLSVAFVPEMDRYIGALDQQFIHEELASRVALAAAAAGAPLIDLAAAFAGDPDPARLYALDGHFTAEGAALAAQTIAQALAAAETDR